MSEPRKLYGDQRRAYILQSLQESTDPVPARALAEKTNVSRQVIVQDISLLKAKDEPIIATAQGYIYVQKMAQKKPQQVIACQHKPDETEHELNIIVDHGVTVVDVTVEHPIYGQLTGSLMLRNRKDVRRFIEKMDQTNASLLSELTEGVHLHTMEADTEQQLQEAYQTLHEAGYLLINKDE
ncbi:3H domain-containing protein [Caldalkalibacillus salinus]|uniref:3H domain-containing protein n=1 Tax=Caldalkalibacillus salinus TaxID=2803787 RepID=UPI0019219495